MPFTFLCKEKTCQNDGSLSGPETARKIGDVNALFFWCLVLVSSSFKSVILLVTRQGRAPLGEKKILRGRRGASGSARILLLEMPHG